MLLGKASVVLVGGAGFIAVNYFASKYVDQYYRDEVRGGSRTAVYVCAVKSGRAAS